MKCDIRDINLDISTTTTTFTYRNHWLGYDKFNLRVDMNHTYTFLLSCCLLLAGSAIAGNPDRQGEAGPGESTRSTPGHAVSALHSLNTSSISGTEAMYLNVAGLSRIKKTQIYLSHTRYIADINMNALSFGQRVGSSGGAFGISLVAMDLGEFISTTEDIPGGTGASFSPSSISIWAFPTPICL